MSSGCKDYDELFGGASRGAFAVRRIMRKAKDRFGDYTPAAKPDPFDYDQDKAEEGDYSRHIQKKIGDVDDEDVVPFVKRKSTKEGRERNKRLNPKTWGIKPEDLKYNERQNRSYFKVPGVEGVFAFPPVKWTDSKGKDWYGLAHYDEEPEEDAPAEGKGGEHYDSIAFPEDATPDEVVSGMMSRGFSAPRKQQYDRPGPRGGTWDLAKDEVAKDIKIDKKKLVLTEAVGHPKAQNRDERYGYSFKQNTTTGDYEELPPNKELPADPTEKERNKAFRNIVSLIVFIEDRMRYCGKLNGEANYYLPRHQDSMANVEGANDEFRKRRANTVLERTVLKKSKKTGRTIGNYTYRPSQRRLPSHEEGDLLNPRTIGTSFRTRRYRPQVYHKLTNDWKVRYKVLKQETEEWDQLADWSVKQLETLTEILRKNEKLLDDLDYDGRYTKPERVVWKPRIFWWDEGYSKESKERELAKYPEELRKLKQEIRDGDKNWWYSSHPDNAGAG